MRYLALLIPLAAAAAGCSDDSDSPTGPSGSRVSFFVTSQTSVTGNLGGLAGADATCRQLATAAGHGTNRIWRAYLSVERGPEGQPIHARDRIGPGPWYNAQLQLLANNPAELHAREGDAALFLDERGQRINGQWTGSPAPVEHDILTGSNADGTLAVGLTCADWTSDSAAAVRTGRPLRRLRAGPEPGRHPGLMELRAHQPELREHGAARRGGPLLLLRAVSQRAASRLKRRCPGQLRPTVAFE